MGYKLVNAPNGAPLSPAPSPSPSGGAEKKPGHIGAYIAIACIVVIAIMVLFLLFGGSLMKKKGSSAFSENAYSDNLSPDKYTLNEPMTDLDPDHEFRLDLDSGVADDPNAVKVFADGSLTIEVPSELRQSEYDGKNHLVVSPTYMTAEDTSTGEEDDIFHKENDNGENWFARWYGYGGYYLVRYNGSDGQPLDKPEVTYFTVKDDVTDPQNQMDIPQNQQFSVADNGGLQITWDPVDGAKTYKVYLQIVNPAPESEYDRYKFRMLAETDQTSVNTLDYDYMTQSLLKRSQEYVDDSGWEAAAYSFSQNYQFDDLVIGDTEDEIYENRKTTEEKGALGLEVADYVPNTSKVCAASICVVAVGDGEDQQSAFQFQSINNLLGQLPISLSNYIQGDYWAQSPDSETDPDGYLKHQMFSYVNMADGTVSIATNVLDTASMVSRSTTVYKGPDEQHVKAYQLTRYSVPYTVKNTSIVSNLSLYSDAFPGGAEEIAQKAQAAVAAVYREAPGAGMLTRADIDTGEQIDWNQFQKDQKPAAEMAEVPYQVNGSSDYVKFVASNLLAGNLYMDITEYASKPGAPDIRDVVQEACWQNPLILSANHQDIQETETDGHIYVTIVEGAYLSGLALDESKDQMLELRQKTDAEAQKIVDGAIQDGMTDTEKVKAINDALCARLEYDYDFFYSSQEGMEDKMSADNDVNPFVMRAYSPVELLNTNKVICQGYAEIFKLCADKAGLTSIIVTGTVPPRPGYSNNRHAWNLVQIDGTWKVVDTTWNDAGDYSNDNYLLLDETDSALAGRSYDKDTLLDSVITDYVDPSLIVA